MENVEYNTFFQDGKSIVVGGAKAIKNNKDSGLKEKLKAVWKKMVQAVETMEDKSYEKNQEKIIKVGEKRDNFQDKSNKIDLDLNQLKKNRQFYQDMLKISATNSPQYKDWYKRLKEIEKRIDEKENKKEKAENSFEKNVDKWENLYRKINKYKNARGLGKVVVPLSVQEENNPFKNFVEDTLKQQAQQAEKLNQQNEQPKPVQEKQEPEQPKPVQEKQEPEQLKQETEHYTQEEKTEIHKLLFEMQIKRIAELETENELLKKDANNQREALNKEREKKQRATKKEIESLITIKKNLTNEIEQEKIEKEKLKQQLNDAQALTDKVVFQSEELFKKIKQNNQNLNQNEGQQR
jgi:hypothetical protein